MEAYLARLSGFAERLGYNNDIINSEKVSHMTFRGKLQSTL